MARDDLPSFPTPSEAFARADLGTIPPPPQQRYGRQPYGQPPTSSGQYRQPTPQATAPQPQQVPQAPFSKPARAQSPYRQPQYGASSGTSLPPSSAAASSAPRRSPNAQPPPLQTQHYGNSSNNGYRNPYVGSQHSVASQSSQMQAQPPPQQPYQYQNGSGNVRYRPPPGQVPQQVQAPPQSNPYAYQPQQAPPQTAPQGQYNYHKPDPYKQEYQPSAAEQYPRNGGGYQQQPDPYKQDPYKQEQFKQDPYKQDPYKQDPYKQPDAYNDPYNREYGYKFSNPQAIPAVSQSHAAPHSPHSYTEHSPAPFNDQLVSPVTRNPPPKRGHDLKAIFDGVDRDKNGFLTEHELSSALVNGDYSKFHPNTVRMMLRMFDRNHDGALYYEEFTQLWKYLRDWRSIFQRFDRDKSECITIDEFSVALDAFGYTLSHDCVGSLFRSGSRPGRGYSQEMSFDMFVQTCINIKTITDIFKAFDTDRDGKITISFEDFLKNVNEFNAPH